MMRTIVVGALGLLWCSVGFASPWVEADDPFLRASIEQLAAAGYLKGHRTTYPLMWSGIARDLRQIDVSTLSEEHQFAFYRVRAALEFSQLSVTRAIRAEFHTESDVQRASANTFGDTIHSRGAVSSATSYTGDFWASRLQTTFKSNAVDGKRYDFSGSYVATTIGNWAISVDQMPVWWGPSHENALVLSTNSMPIQAVRFNRLSDDTLYGLDLLGQFHATAFVGRSQNSSYRGDNYVGGARAVMRPHRRVEIGGSYVGHWESNGGFYSQMVGLDTRLVAFDRFSLYGEVASNNREFDDVAYTVGLDLHFSDNNNRIWQLYSEISDVPALFYDSSNFYGDSPDYSGYRRWGANIGAAQDQDVSAASFGVSTQGVDGRSWALKFRRVEYGKTNWPTVFRVGQIGLEKVESFQVNFTHQRPFGDSLFTMAVTYRNDDVARSADDLTMETGRKHDVGASVGWEFRF